jgi:hypothetical protein
MKIDREKGRKRRRRKHAAEFLRQDLSHFAQDERFAVPFAQALEIYWDGYYTIETAEEMSQQEASHFFDWFVFDYDLGEGRRLLGVYKEEEWQELAKPQQEVLSEWIEVGPARAYTLVDYDADILHLQDFLSGEVCEVGDYGSLGEAERGDLVLARLVPVYDQMEFSVTAVYLPQAEIANLSEKMEKGRAEYEEDHPDADYEEFLRYNNYRFVHHALEQADEHGRAPVARLNPDRPDKEARTAVQSLKDKLT